MLYSEPEILKEIGLKLRNLRIKGGYNSYEQFAFENGLDRKYYWQIENGTNLSMKYLVKILNCHNIKLSDFFKEF